MTNDFLQTFVFGGIIKFGDRMKIAELAKQFNLKPKDLRDKIESLGFDIGKKARTIKDETANEIIKKFQQEQKFLEQTKKEEKPEKLEKPKVEVQPEEKIAEIPSQIRVKDFAAILNLPVTELIRQLMKNGVMANINENIDFETAAIIADDCGFKAIKTKDREENISELITTHTADFHSRAPVVTIIGHVDHGKTTLLDYIRKSNIAGSEHGGITQKITAYQVEVNFKGKKNRITFIDTPGHEAFVSMREHGVKITDIAILVVAADDGVKPQTVEAVSHAKAAGVPIIVAINKIDRPQADIQKTKQQLSDLGLVPEDWGGTTICVPISAKTGKGVNDLLEMILLVSEMEKFQSDFSLPGEGVVVESHLDKQSGPMISLLVNKGYIEVGDSIVIGSHIGKIRGMQNCAGANIEKAAPSDCVSILGFPKVPNFGDQAISFTSPKEAKNFLTAVINRRNALQTGVVVQSDQSKKGVKIPELNLILKADSAGSLQAVKESLNNLKIKGANVKILIEAVGNISESDVMAAQTSKALVVGFKSEATVGAKKLAKDSKVKMITYQIIYQLLDDVKNVLKDLVEPEFEKTKIGTGIVLAIFFHKKNNQIIGIKVASGFVTDKADFQIFRKKEEIGTGKINSLQREKKEVEKVNENDECGLNIDSETEILVDDKLVFEALQEIKS
jgi:translation initiation factor IF-2